MGEVDHLFVISGYQGAEKDPEKLMLTDKLLQAVLASAQVVRVGQPLLIAGDLNADPLALTHPWPRGFLLESLSIWPWLTLLGLGRSRMSRANLGLMTVLGLAGILWLVAPMRLLRPLLAGFLRDGSRLCFG